MTKTIAIIDDEEDLRLAIKKGLAREGYKVKDFSHADDLFKFAKSASPDLFILDIMLPDIDGLAICRRIRSTPKLSQIPIIFLSAKSEEIDKVLGLELGADDYMTKPFSLKELAARIKARLRKTEESGKIPAGRQNELMLNDESFEVFADGKKIPLTLTEFKILQLLYSKPEKVFSRDKILDHVWGEEKEVFDRTIDVHIKNLREKIGKYGKNIKNVRSIGYRYEK
ncbi:MAG: response regulator transcription factor [Elusimicrobiota bacterium]|jgi:DNA-binding response OmpR family regulator|nr:response regulator transcription factor [Elusimicrobiota bacterium]